MIRQLTSSTLLALPRKTYMQQGLGFLTPPALMTIAAAYMGRKCLCGCLDTHSTASHTHTHTHACACAHTHTHTHTHTTVWLSLCTPQCGEDVWVGPVTILNYAGTDAHYLRTYQTLREKTSNSHTEPDEYQLPSYQERTAYNEN